jgi:hypothetical protein
MGTKMAPSYAKIFRGNLEKLIIQSAPYKRWFFNGSLVPGLSTCLDTVIMWDARA